jgi:hypothetical protein
VRGARRLAQREEGEGGVEVLVLLVVNEQRELIELPREREQRWRETLTFPPKPARAHSTT